MPSIAHNDCPAAGVVIVPAHATLVGNDVLPVVGLGETLGALSDYIV